MLHVMESAATVHQLAVLHVTMDLIGEASRPYGALGMDVGMMYRQFVTVIVCLRLYISTEQI